MVDIGSPANIDSTYDIIALNDKFIFSMNQSFPTNFSNFVHIMCTITQSSNMLSKGSLIHISHLAVLVVPISLTTL